MEPSSLVSNVLEYCYSLCNAYCLKNKNEMWVWGLCDRYI
jgi:hypothetical protein